MSTDPISPATRTKLARSVLEQNLHVRRGEHVTIEAWTHTLPWAAAFAREARRLGAIPLVTYDDDDAYWAAVDDGQDALLGKSGAHEAGALAKTDVFIHMWGPTDRRRFSALPETRLDKLFAWNPGWYAAADKAGLRGARLDIGRIYPATAKAYGVDLRTWGDQVVRGTMVAPEALARTAAPIVKALKRGKKVRIRDDHGTDLTLGLAHRPVQAFTGHLQPGGGPRRLVSLPSGYLRAALDETVAEGTIVANRPNYTDPPAKTKALGGVLRFRHGKLTSAHFDSGGEGFAQGYKAGGKGRDRPGLIGFGLNPALRDTPPDEDAELGAVLVGVGGNRGLGGKNTSPFFGWVVNAGATIEVDGHPLVFRR
jgi:leucyl aminopeptidase (aminopeptidase T)